VKSTGEETLPSNDLISATATTCLVGDERQVGGVVSPRRPCIDWNWIVGVCLVALTYIATAVIGFSLAIEPGNVTAVWPPSGIALAALLIGGYRMWPGIWIGSFVSDTWIFKGMSVGKVDVVVAAVIGIGSVSQAVAGASLLRRSIGGNDPLGRVVHLFLFLAIAMAACTIGATIGVASLCSAGSVSWTSFGGTWLTWWLGDLIGVLVAAPLILAWGLPAPGDCEGRFGEALLMFGVLALLSLVGVGQWFANDHYPLGFLVFPGLIWAALRFNRRIVTLAVAGLAVASVWWTANGKGPFVMHQSGESILMVQVFAGVFTLVSLTLFASVTERRDAEERAQQLNASLVRRTHELAEETDRAKESDRLKSMFLTTVSHELRTPLNSILGFSGLLHQGLAGELQPEQKKQIGMILGSSRHLLSLVNDVLDLAKIEAGELQVSLQPFDLHQTIESSCESLRPTAERKGLGFAVRVAPGVGWIVGDRRRVEQVLLNLIGNAIKFTDTGQVTVTADVISSDGSKSDCDIRNERGLVTRIQVTDTGIGIRTEDLDKLFKPFRQLNSGLRCQYDGTGLGLVICKKLLDAMGGGISVESHGVQSQCGSGCVFTVTLPINVPSADREGGP
jgi:signal transduction histidine kinase